MVYDHIHVGGGGPNVMALLGMFQYIESANLDIDPTYELSGSSAGAILAFAVALGYSCNELMTLVDQWIDTGIIRSFCQPKIDHMLNTSRDPLNRHLFDMSPVWKELDCMMRKKHPDLSFENVTFEQVQRKLARTLHIVGSDLTHQQTVIFNARTHPTMLLKQAFQITTAIPPIMQPVEYNGTLYFDGCVMEDLREFTSHKKVLILQLSRRVNTSEITTLLSTKREDAISRIAVYMSCMMKTLLCARDIPNAHRTVYLESSAFEKVCSMLTFSCVRLTHDNVFRTWVMAHETITAFFKKRV